MTHKLLLVGAGKWGRNYISTIKCIQEVELQIASRQNWKQMIDQHPDGVMVCTPPQSHVEIASYALERQIPTMIEKPLSLSMIEAQQLKKYTTPILVNHVHLFSDGFQFLKKVIVPKEISTINTIGCGFNPDRDYSSLWDYGPHDLSMILSLLETVPKKIKAENHHGLYKIDLQFDQCRTTSLVGNKAKSQQRLIEVNCHGSVISYNDRVRPSHHSLPLTAAIKTFIKIVSGKSDPRTGLDLSFKILTILEECDRQLNA